MYGKTTLLVDENDEELNKFSFDYCFWSHDGYKINKNGYIYAEDEYSNYADQKYVYDVLGKEIL